MTAGADTEVVVEATPVLLHVLAVRLARIREHLLPRERAGQVFGDIGVHQIDGEVGFLVQAVTEIREDAGSLLRGMIAVSIDLGIGHARVVAERTAHVSGRDLAAQVPEGAALEPELEGRRRRSGVGQDVERSPHGVSAVAERVRALPDLDSGRRHQVDRFEVAESVRVLIGKTVHEDVEAAKVKIPSKARASDGDLTLVRSEAGLHQDTRRVVERILQVVSERALDCRFGDVADRTRHLLESRIERASHGDALGQGGRREREIEDRRCPRGKRRRDRLKKSGFRSKQVRARGETQAVPSRFVGGRARHFGFGVVVEGDDHGAREDASR